MKVIGSWDKRDMKTAKSEKAMEAILKQAKEDVDSIPKIIPGEKDWVEKEMDERVQLINAAIADLNQIYDEKIENFTKAQQKKLKTILDKGIFELNRMRNMVPAGSVDVGDGVSRVSFEKELERRFGIAKYNVEDRMKFLDSLNLGLAKGKAIKELKAYKNAKNYRTAQKKELENAIEAGGKAINKAAAKEGAAQALEEAKAKIDKIKTAAQMKQEDTGKRPITEKIVPAKIFVSGKIKAKKSFTAKWKKQTKDVDGYEICYSTSSKFPKKGTVIKKVDKNTTTKLTVTRLKTKKKYYVKARTYKTVKSQKYVSAWSSAKPVTTKK